MTGVGPLADARLLAVDAYLDEGKLEDAQHALAQIGHEEALQRGVAYLAARLLYLRGRLDQRGFIERLRDLVALGEAFPQAERLLEQLGAPFRVEPALEPGPAREDATPPGKASPTPWPVAALGSAPPVAPAAFSAPALEIGTASLPTSELEPSAAPARRVTRPYEAGDEPLEPAPASPAKPFPALLDAPRASAIPRGPRVPRFTPPPDPSPSYAPSAPRRQTPDPAPATADIELPDLEVAPGAGSAARIRSAAPPPIELGALPSFLELRQMVEQGEYRRAINSMDSAGAALAPEHVLLRARALIGAGQAADGRAELARLCGAPLLDPDVRAGCARVLVELGELDVALEQARVACSDDPGPPMNRITLAWAALRRARRDGDPALVGEAEEMLDGVELRGGPRPGLLAALKACVDAEIGDPEDAIGAAQRALGLDAQSVDALAALALASARLGRDHDTAQAWLRLLEASYVEADALSDRIERLGIDLSELNPAERAPVQTSETAIWEPRELSLAEGRREAAVLAFEAEAKQRLDKITERGALQDLPVIATVAANLLTSSVPWRDFAPWDLSLASIARLEAALDVLYGREPRAGYDSDDFPAQILVGAYLGEALRQAHDGRWSGSLANAPQATVVATEREFRPFTVVRARLREATPFPDALRFGGARSHRIPNPLPPPCPWGETPWPPVRDMRTLGRALTRSVIGAWCERYSEGLLDRSIASVASLDDFLALIAPAGATASPGDGWARRIAVLLGAYIGEVLCETLGGAWGPDVAVQAPGDYRVMIDDLEAAPVEHVLGRLVAETPRSLSEYVTKLAHRLGH